MINVVRNSIPFNGEVVNVDTMSTSVQRYPMLEETIQDCVELNKQHENKQPSFLQKLVQQPTLNLSFLPFDVGGGYLIYKEFSLLKKLKNKKLKNKTVKAKQSIEYIKTLPKKFMILAALTIPLYMLIDYTNKKVEKKNLEKAQKIVDEFNAKNNTDVKLTKHQNLGIMIGGKADPISATITLDNKTCADVLYSAICLKPLLNHELVHMKQYILMGNSKDGIKRMNLLFVKSIAKGFDDETKQEVLAAYKEIQNGGSEKYKNTIINLLGNKMKLVDFETALYKVLFVKETTQDDIPIVINKEFYEKNNAQKGQLSDEEQKKADAYFEAYINYPKKIGFKEVFLPHSDYRENLLEKEAYATMPWYFRI